MQMKLNSLIVVGILVAALVVMSAPIARADSVPDPHIIMNNIGDPELTGSCAADGLTSDCFDSTNSATNPLILSFFNDTQTFTFDSSTPLDALYIELVGPAIVPGVYDCSGNVFLGACSGYFPPAIPGGLELAADVLIPAFATVSVTVTPEPSVLLLMGLGLAALIGLRRKLGIFGPQSL